MTISARISASLLTAALVLALAPLAACDSSSSEPAGDAKGAASKAPAAKAADPATADPEAEAEARAKAQAELEAKVRAAMKGLSPSDTSAAEDLAALGPEAELILAQVVTEQLVAVAKTQDPAERLDALMPILGFINASADIGETAIPALKVLAVSKETAVSNNACLHLSHFSIGCHANGQFSKLD